MHHFLTTPQSADPHDQEFEWWYSYRSQRYAAPIDEFGNTLGRGEMQITLCHWKVVRKTPKGVWVRLYGAEQWVGNNWRKKACYPTIAEAKESFLARKKRFIQIYTARIREAYAFMIMMTMSDEEGKNTLSYGQWHAEEQARREISLPTHLEYHHRYNG